MSDTHSLTTSNKNQSQLPYHTLSPEQTLNALNASSSGLSQTEGERRLQQYGYNELASDEKRSLSKCQCELWSWYRCGDEYRYVH